jgi:hypothetical protein
MGELFLHDLQKYIDEWECSVFVETGTGVGTGIEFALRYPFSKLYSIEYVEELYEACLESFDDSRLTLLNHDSLTGLKQILEENKDVPSMLFWLDAHFPGADFGFNSYDHMIDVPELHKPLAAEIELIAKSRPDKNDVFIIDDLQIYEDGPFELLDPQFKEKYGDLGIDFIHDNYGKTHVMTRDYRHQGFMILTPKTSLLPNVIENDRGSERSVEVPFMEQALRRYVGLGSKVLDVGGVPTHYTDYVEIANVIGQLNCNYQISDFRSGSLVDNHGLAFDIDVKYPGDFVDIDFGDSTFDVILFLSSLEHFPQCSEGDLVYREGQDRLGYEKALSLLDDHGKIIITVPFGKPVWQQYQQNYNMEKFLQLTAGSTILESYVYSLQPNETWVKTDPKDMEEVLYTTKAYGVGCFVLEGD